MKKNETMKGNEEYNPQGNWALRDQKLAFDFIHSNGHHFGGDSNRITLIGCGSGAQSIGFHITNPQLSNSIRNAILLRRGALDINHCKPASEPMASSIVTKFWHSASR